MIQGQGRSRQYLQNAAVKAWKVVDDTATEVGDALQTGYHVLGQDASVT